MLFSEGGALVPDLSALFNNDFATPSIDECTLKLPLDDFANHPSVLVIKNSALRLDFSFQPVSVSCVAESLANSNTTKSAGPDGLSPKVLKLGVLQNYLILYHLMCVAQSMQTF